MKNPLKSGPMLAFYCAIAVGFVYVLTEIGAKQIGVIQIAAYTQLIGAVFIYAYSLITRKRIRIRETIKKYKVGIAKITISRNILGSILIYYGFQLSNATRGGFLSRFEALFVMILGVILLGTKMKKHQILAVITIIIGAFLLSTSGDLSVFGEAQIGDLLIIGAALMTGYSFIPAKVLTKKKVTPLTLNFFGNLIGGICIIIIGLLLGTNLNIFTMENIIFLAGFALLFNLITMQLYYEAIAKTKPWIVAAIVSFSAVISALIAFTFLGQTLEPIQIAGAFIILISTIAITFEGMETN